MKVFIELATHLGHLLRDARITKINNKIEIVTSFKDVEKIIQYLKVLFDVKIS